MTHSREPWINCNDHIDDAYGSSILRLVKRFDDMNCLDVRRAVDCVNAMIGIRDPHEFVAMAKQVLDPSDWDPEWYSNRNSNNA